MLQLFHLVFYFSVAGKVEELTQLQRGDLLSSLSCLCEEVLYLVTGGGCDDGTADVVGEVLRVVSEHLETLESQPHSLIVQPRSPHAEVLA